MNADYEISTRRRKLKKIYTLINKSKLMGDEPIELNYNNLLTDLYTTNTLINNTFEIFNDDNTKDEEKAHQLLKLTDNNGNKIIKSEDDARLIIKNNKEPLLVFFKKIKAMKAKKIYEVINRKKQLGGSGENSAEATADVDDILQNIERVALEKSKKFNDIINGNPEKLTESISEIPNELMENNIKNIERISNIIDWVFHPLWKLENKPIWGTIISIPIDLVDTLIENTIMLIEMIYPIVSLILSIVGTAAISASVAAIPVVGPVLGGASWENIIQPFLDWLIPNFFKIIAFYINIWRRDLPAAYINAVDFIPFMENTLHVLAGVLLKLNKYIDLVYPVTTVLRTYIEMGSNLAVSFIENPNAFTDLEKFYIDIIKPNKEKIPLIKKIPNEILENDNKIFATVYETLHELVVCGREAIKTNNLQLCIDKFNIQSITNKITEKVTTELHNRKSNLNN